jgi:uncharacterized protein YdeI (YjbR/CyaY-like superfamily)
MSEEKAGLPVMAFASAPAFAAWLGRPPATSRGLWLKLAKKDDGRWERAYAPQSTAALPPDLQAAIDASPAAQRIAKFVAMLERGETLHPPRSGTA